MTLQSLAARVEGAEEWTISIGNGFEFDVRKDGAKRDSWSDASLNGIFPTKLAALECVIENMEETRAALNQQIARAKRMRRLAALRATLEKSS